MDFDKLEIRLQLLNEMVSIFYALPGCSAGGALHVVLDDGNVRDSDIIFCHNELFLPQNESQRYLGLAIIQELMMLSPAQRWLWHNCESIETIRKAKNKKLISTPEGYSVWCGELRA